MQSITSNLNFLICKFSNNESNPIQLVTDDSRAVLGLMLFSKYVHPFSNSIIGRNHGQSINFPFYADNTQLYLSMSNDQSVSAKAKIKACIDEI